MNPMRDGISVTPHFAEIVTFLGFRIGVTGRPSGIRVNIPTHKKGTTIPYSEVRERFPDIARYYQSDFLSERISRASRVGVLPTPLHDESSCSLLIYDRPGDRIGWH